MALLPVQTINEGTISSKCKQAWLFIYIYIYLYIYKCQKNQKLVTTGDNQFTSAFM